MMAAAERLTPVLLELGGKDAMIVCADADLDRAAQGALIGSCMNTGQYCCGTERIYVVEDVYEPFVAKVIAAAKELRQTDDVDDTDVGATFWDRQLTIIEDHVSDALANGAETRPFFRFPFGAVNSRVLGIVNNMGYVGVRWTVDSLGWQGTSGGMTVQKVVDRVLAGLQPGEIVLMHVGSHPTDHSMLDAAALPQIVDAIRARGYTFVTVRGLTGG